MVDDDEPLLRACHRAIGHEVRLRTATNSADALHLLGERAPDAVVIDLRLGGEDGLELVRQVRALRPACKILLVSSYASVEIAVRAMHAGADDVRQKPVAPRALMIWAQTGSWDKGPSTVHTAERVLWEHAHRMTADCGGNQSEAARRLRISRPTLRAYLRTPAPRR